MAFTAHCDIYAALHENGINRVIHHIRRQRPSMFNYATQAVADNPELLCHVIDVHPIVGIRNNPLLTIEDPLPIPGTNYGLNFAVQLADLQVDFHPGNRKLALPKELDPPLKPQRMAVKVRLCAGLGCPSADIVDKLVPRPAPTGPKQIREDRAKSVDIIPLPTKKLHCFCLDVFLTAGIRIKTYDGKPWLEPFADGLEIVDIKPDGLEESLECYAMLLLKLTVLPKLRILLERAPLELMEGVNVTLKPTPTGPGIPNNPAIEQDQLKVFITVEV